MASKKSPAPRLVVAPPPPNRQPVDIAERAYGTLAALSAIIDVLRTASSTDNGAEMRDGSAEDALRHCFKLADDVSRDLNQLDAERKAHDARLRKIDRYVRDMATAFDPEIQKELLYFINDERAIEAGNTG